MFFFGLNFIFIDVNTAVMFGFGAHLQLENLYYYKKCFNRLLCGVTVYGTCL